MEQIICKKCCMDKSAQEITFDKNGVCGFCHQAQKSLKEIEEEKHKLPDIIQQIKKDGRGREYDALIGLSGGVDSSTALCEAVKAGLRLLAFSVDNGWNRARESDENVLKLVETLKVPFYRYTIDLEKFRELQAAFMKAGQINIEIPSDHLILATSLELARKYGIKWILSGGNVATESIMPRSWGYQPRDLRHIKAIYKWSTRKKLSGLPTCGLLKWNIYKWWYGIKTFYILDYLNYNRDQAIKLLEKYQYKPYGEKHCESTFTWWFQSFYLYTKFGIDKRKAHYSSLINSGQMTRAEAMDKLTAAPIYPKLGIEEKVMKYPRRPYTDFPNDEKLFNFISLVIRKLQWRF